LYSEDASSDEPSAFVFNRPFCKKPAAYSHDCLNWGYYALARLERFAFSALENQDIGIVSGYLAYRDDRGHCVIGRSYGPQVSALPVMTGRTGKGNACVRRDGPGGYDQIVCQSALKDAAHRIPVR
jgi:hypothetical protein